MESSQFERQVELGFFLKHWAEIRISPAMKDIWQQIRVGRHPGFEEGVLLFYFKNAWYKADIE